MDHHDGSCNLVAGRGILDYPSSVVHPSVYPFPLNNFKGFGRNLMLSDSDGFRKSQKGGAKFVILSIHEGGSVHDIF